MSSKNINTRSKASWWVGRAPMVRRAFWWGGLVLLSPAPMSFLDMAAVHDFFSVFPFPLKVPPSGSSRSAATDLAEVIEEKRIIATLVAGLLLWLLCILFSSDEASYRYYSSMQSDPMSNSMQSDPMSKNGVAQRVVICVVSAVFVFSAAVIILLFSLSIDLYYNPTP